MLLGAVPATADFQALAGAVDEAAGAADVRELGADKELKYLEVLVHQDCRQQALDALRSFGFSFAQLRDLTGTVRENIVRSRPGLPGVEGPDGPGVAVDIGGLLQGLGPGLAVQQLL